MKYLLLLVALLLVTQPIAAQAPRPAVRPDSLPTRLAAAPDTAAALHRLFAAKRKKLAFILLGTATAEVAGQVAIGATAHGGTGAVNERDLDHFVTALLAVPVVIAEVLFYAQYNQKHEQRAVYKLQAHQLPQHLKHQLKANYFR